jgi:thiamine biosynthesis protein ThiS
MQVQLNGEARETPAVTVAALVAELGLDVRKVAVERNLEIVPRSLYGATPLTTGDRIEIVHFIGGG